MKKIQLKVEFSEEKIKTIKLSLKGKDKDFDGEVLKILNGLYNKSVHKLLIKDTEIRLESENKVNEDVEELHIEESKEISLTH